MSENSCNTRSKKSFVSKVVYLLYYTRNNTPANEILRLEEDFELDYAVKFAINTCKALDLFKISRGKVKGCDLEKFVNSIS